MQDGWTVKPQSFFDFDDDELDSQSTENVFSLDNKSTGSQQVKELPDILGIQHFMSPIP
jgi:hypothetical protein